MAQSRRGDLHAHGDRLGESLKAFCQTNIETVVNPAWSGPVLAVAWHGGFWAVANGTGFFW